MIPPSCPESWTILWTADFWATLGFTDEISLSISGGRGGGHGRSFPLYGLFPPVIIARRRALPPSRLPRSAGAAFRRCQGAPAGRRPGAGHARRQPHGAAVHWRL